MDARVMHGSSPNDATSSRYAPPPGAVLQASGIQHTESKNLPPNISHDQQAHTHI